LDRLDLASSGKIFTAVALAAVKKINVDTQTVHLDSSSFHFHGAYLPQMPEVYFTTTPEKIHSVKHLPYQFLSLMDIPAEI
jgi:hypothetical protein